MSAVINRIESILTSEYDVGRYVELMSEIFDNLQLQSVNNPRKEFSNFSSHIESYTHIGTYTSPDKKKILILSVELKNQAFVENSRSTQRSYAKRLIENGGADAAIIAFYTTGENHWRLSFVRLDYEMKFENGKLKTAENMTPARRYSFLVGKDEPCHTAIDRFRLFIEDHACNPTLDELENSFSVEAVTKEFFELYCEKFLQLRNHLEKNEDFMYEATEHHFTSAQFAKKLMGQIVFLYFLQKKGWLGVSAWPRAISKETFDKLTTKGHPRFIALIKQVYVARSDGNYYPNRVALDNMSTEDELFLVGRIKGGDWGTGPRRFMRNLFEDAKRLGRNFFDDYLEPLFYNALNVNRNSQNFYDPELHCRIPFLSGGLFDPIDGYDWRGTHFNLPNEIFSNRKDANDRLADGILDIFDRYNFTMSEDEPMEREVAIDPEMLGKVFENLLDVVDRKSKGAFYTPREIVHYMCQESLINYLTGTLKVSETAVRDFILYGDFMKDNDGNVLNEHKAGSSYDLYISEELYQLDANGKPCVDRIMEMDKALQDVRVADPAVGSGAFPLGMLNEIVRARQNLTTYMVLTMKAGWTGREGQLNREIAIMKSNSRSARVLKYETIRNCIFAVDIDPSAVDIAQLRLWLSLVIDDEIDPEGARTADGYLFAHADPLPLPNLECNILCGNSLIDELQFKEGGKSKSIKLINESDLLGNVSDRSQINFYQSAFEERVKTLIAKQDELFKETSTEKKYQLLQEIEGLRDQVIYSQLEGASDAAKTAYEESKLVPSKPFVLWQLSFARVFREKGGFDIVIGNPPYLESRSPNFPNELKDQLQEGIKERYGVNAGWFSRGADFLIYFFEKSLRLINHQGTHTFITQNSWLDTEFGKKFQDYLLHTTNVLAIVDSDFKYFENADINTVITFLEGNTGCTKPVIFARCHKSLETYFLPIDPNAVIDPEAASYKVLSPKDKILSEMKWGFIFTTEDRLFKLISKASSVGKKISDIPGFSIGQGLNLKKDCIITSERASQLGADVDGLVPFFTTEESGFYSWQKCSHYLLKKTKSSKYPEITKDKSILLFDDTSTRKKPPLFIMPRGIGARHFCCYNQLEGYSASCVDIYSENGIELTDDALRLWITLNSTYCWLIREIAGRKNLGGGMLKAEAVDLEPFALYFPFKDMDTIRDIFRGSLSTNIQNGQIEMDTDMHRRIDDLVFSAIGISAEDGEYLRTTFEKMIDARYNKVTAK